MRGALLTLSVCEVLWCHLGGSSRGCWDCSNGPVRCTGGTVALPTHLCLPYLGHQHHLCLGMGVLAVRLRHVRDGSARGVRSKLGLLPGAHAVVV